MIVTETTRPVCVCVVHHDCCRHPTLIPLSADSLRPITMSTGAGRTPLPANKTSPSMLFMKACEPPRPWTSTSTSSAANAVGTNFVTPVISTLTAWMCRPQIKLRGTSIGGPTACLCGSPRGLRSELRCERTTLPSVRRRNGSLRPARFPTPPTLFGNPAFLT